MWTSILACLVFTAVVSAQVDPRCNGARIIKGCAYLKDKDRCDCWIRCTFDEDGKSVKSERQCCGCGMFWNENVMTCEPAEDIKCNPDPCVGPTTTYAYPGNCRTYWTCDGGRTNGGQCCPPGQRYDGGSPLCVIDATCKDECLCFDRTTVTPIPCPFRDNPLDVHTYYVDNNGQTFLMACAPGTNYNKDECKCKDRVPVTELPCPADFNMVCNSAELKDSANNVYILNINVGVDTVDNECDFDGSSSELIIPRYANMDWRKQWAVYIAFDGNANVNANGVLWANSKSATGAPGVTGSIIISVQGPSVVAYLRTQGNVGHTLSVPHYANVRNNVYVSKDNDKFVLCVENDVSKDVVKDQKIVPLMTERVPCAVIIGDDDHDNYFQGVIFENRVYIYCVPKDFCPK